MRIDLTRISSSSQSNKHYGELLWTRCTISAGIITVLHAITSAQILDIVGWIVVRSREET